MYRVEHETGLVVVGAGGWGVLACECSNGGHQIEMFKYLLV